MEEENNRLGKLLKGNFKLDRMQERLDDLKTLTELIHHYRVNKARSSEIAEAIVNYLKEGR